jgi:predicted HNH restriction endonuclease
MRRWATRKGAAGTEHATLFGDFVKLVASFALPEGLPPVQVIPEMIEDAFEGEIRKRWVQHRSRENKFRAKKLADAMRRDGGQLICEVPDCGFNFQNRYGELGAGYAEVHHKVPLSKAPSKGRTVRLSDLAVVCANCHRMIHRNGQCRPLDNLIR